MFVVVVMLWGDTEVCFSCFRLCESEFPLVCTHTHTHTYTLTHVHILKSKHASTRREKGEGKGTEGNTLFRFIEADIQRCLPFQLTVYCQPPSLRPSLAPLFLCAVAAVAEAEERSSLSLSRTQSLSVSVQFHSIWWRNHHSHTSHRLFNDNQCDVSSLSTCPQYSSVYSFFSLWYTWRVCGLPYSLLLFLIGPMRRSFVIRKGPFVASSMALSTSLGCNNSTTTSSSSGTQVCAIPVSRPLYVMGPFMCTRVWRYQQNRSGPQVLGTDVPSFRHFPYRAQDTLHLYRHFLQLIYHHHSPEERPDLLFRLRNEFASKRHITGAGMISAAIRRGEGILALQRQILDAREGRQRGVASKAGGAQSVDGLWDQLQMVSGSVLPGLKNYEQSLPVSNGTYTRQSSTHSVYSRRR